MHINKNTHTNKMNKSMSLHGHTLYLVQNTKNAYVSCTKTKPVNIMSFISKRDANYISNELNKSTSFSILPTLMNAYVLNTDSGDATEKTSEYLQTNVFETTSSYLSLIRNLNRINAVLIRDIEKTRTGHILLHCDENGLPHVYTDLQMMLGNLEKMYDNSVS